SQIEFQVDALGGQRQAIFDGRDAFVELSGLGELTCELLESGQIGRTPRSGAPQLLDPVPRTPRTAQCCAEQGLDFRVAAAAGSPFERLDRLSRGVPGDQGVSQNE